MEPRVLLWPNGPNPFTGGTTIRFTLPNASPVRVAVFDAQGRFVRTLLQESRSSGTHAIEWNGRDDRGRLVPVGVYLSRVEAGALSAERKILRVE